MTDITQDRDALIALTSDIVAAHVSNNHVAVDQVSALIAGVYEALSSLGAAPAIEEAPRKPAVSVRASVKPDHVTCLECGKQMKLLKRHLSVEHNLTVDEYRQRWGLSASHPLVAPNYAARRADLAKQIGFGSKLKGQEATASPQKSATVSAPLAKSAPKAKVANKPKAAPKVKVQPKAEAQPKATNGRKLGLKFKAGDAVAPVPSAGADKAAG